MDIEIISVGTIHTGSEHPCAGTGTQAEAFQTTRSFAQWLSWKACVLSLTREHQHLLPRELSISSIPASLCSRHYQANLNWFSFSVFLILSDNFCQSGACLMVSHYGCNLHFPDYIMRLGIFNMFNGYSFAFFFFFYWVVCLFLIILWG